jgi:hypothetical protein
MGGGLSTASAARVLLASTSAAATALLDFRGFEAGAVFFLEVFAVPLMGCIARDLVFDEFLDIA